jgi:SAM-dependent MidA family methyltransferase
MLDPQQDVYLQVRQYFTPFSSDFKPNNLAPCHQAQSSKLVFANEVFDPINFAIFRIEDETLHVLRIVYQ